MTQLFPDMPLPPLAANGEGPPAAPPPSNTSGVMPGLNSSLIDLLQNYRPGDLGICNLDEKITLTLNYPEWAWYVWMVQPANITIPASQGADEIVYTIPGDRRAYLEAYSVTRASGDNDFDYFFVDHPDGYWEGGAQAQEVLIRPVSAATVLMWPDVAFTQTISLYSPSPKLLEPGTQIGFRSGATGVSETVFTVRLCMRMTKLVRETGAQLT